MSDKPKKESSGQTKELAQLTKAMQPMMRWLPFTEEEQKEIQAALSTSCDRDTYLNSEIAYQLLSELDRFS